MNFIQQAYKGKNKWTGYLKTFGIVVLATQLLAAIPVGIIIAIYFGIKGEKPIKSEGGALFFENMDNNLSLFLITLIFAFGLVTLLWAVKTFHKRKAITVVTSRKKLDWNRILFAFGIGFTFITIEVLTSYFFASEAFIWNFQLIPFLILVIISFLFLPLQTSLEEVLFRGYLMQGFGTWFKKPWIALLITSVGFGLLHFGNTEVEKLGIGAIPFYILPGLLFGLTTLLDEGTELSLGLHAANNIGACIFVTSSWSALQTDALWIDTAEPSLVWTDYLSMLIGYPLILLIFSKKYGWKNWKAKLFNKVEKPIESIDNKIITE